MKNSNLTPIWLSIAAAIGIYIGVWLTQNAMQNASPVVVPTSTTSTYNKLNEVLNIIDEAYVDTINKHKLVEDILPQVLKDLDPHSVYVPKDEVESMNEDLEGSFSGIGVQFNIQNDTIMIVDVIAGGPSERLGILPGDRIVMVNDSNFTGKSISNNKVVKTLRGKKGTVVKVGIKRNGSNKIWDFSITRDDIPVNSVDIAYPITPTIGYIKISRFGANTYNEFLTQLMWLREKEGCKDFIIDLRNNSGGYLSAAIYMINEWLPKGQLIVYTEGRNYRRENAVADGTGRFKNNNVCVLINEWSASASEIFAGAIQDQDRGWVIGRRSFGKGLVQQQMPLSDGSEMRLTIARYYTPSGRCIQKPYKQGEVDEYDADIENRYEHGEFFAQDSIVQNDSVVYYTSLGRKVYGGGGVMPDYFVGQDTTQYTPYYRQAFNSMVLYNFCFSYTDKNRATLKKYKTWQELTAYLETTSYVEEFIQYAEKKGIKRNDKEIKQSEKLIKNQIQAYICRNILGDKGFYPVLNLDDKTVQKAVEVLNSDEHSPESKDWKVIQSLLQ
ncbi:MAG: S41 family peptidase [Paludibacteraceae bacterium]|nr:S41 family peptidase [Paludibacteraceae bacterium]